MILRSGKSIQLRQKGTSTLLEIVEPSGKGKRLWKSDLEVCSHLSLSPDGRYVAFICELNGLMVSDVQRLVARKGVPVGRVPSAEDDRAQPVTYKIILPDAYVGWVRVDFGVESAPILDGGNVMELHVDEEGRLRTSSLLIVGDPDMVRFDFVYQSSGGPRTVPDDLVIHNTLAGGETMRADDYAAEIKPTSWYFLVAPKSYRELHPFDASRPPNPGRLSLR